MIDAGTIALDEPAGPPDSTVRHLLAHASGLGFDDGAALSKPERRRVYSNAGFDLLGALVSDRAGMPFAQYATQAVFEPLGMHASSIEGTPSAGGAGPLVDLLRFARELLRPTLLTPATLALATTVAFPGLDGVLPGYGRCTPNDWGLGFEIRDSKSPHWTGRHNSASTFGHFGRSGSFVWIDPSLGLGCVALADTAFGPWAAEAWPVVLRRGDLTEFGAARELAGAAGDVVLGALVGGHREDPARRVVLDEHPGLPGAGEGEEPGRLADPARLLHVVGHDDDRVAVLELGDEVFDRQRRDRVKGRARLVHQQHFGFDGDGPRDAQPLLLATGKCERRLLQSVLDLGPQVSTGESPLDYGVEVFSLTTAQFQAGGDVVDRSTSSGTGSAAGTPCRHCGEAPPGRRPARRCRGRRATPGR